jgi:hypothetical protein
METNLFILFSSILGDDNDLNYFAFLLPDRIFWERRYCGHVCPHPVCLSSHVGIGTGFVHGMDVVVIPLTVNVGVMFNQVSVYPMLP